MSSDESVTIEVVSHKLSNLHHIPIEEMSIEIVDDLNDDCDVVNNKSKPPCYIFQSSYQN